MNNFKEYMCEETVEDYMFKHFGYDHQYIIWHDFAFELDINFELGWERKLRNDQLMFRPPLKKFPAVLKMALLIILRCAVDVHIVSDFV